MNDQRSEQAVAFGVIPVRLGGQERVLPTLKIKPAREWKAKLARVAGGTIAEFNVPGQGGADSIDGVAKLGLLAGDTILDLVLEYDQGGALGGRDWIEEHADDAEIYTVLKAILAVHFPFVRDVLGATKELGRLLTDGTSVPSVPASSPPSPSPTGTSIPERSKKPSTSGS
jgi:hypothetical protein